MSEDARASSRGPIPRDLKTERNNFMAAYHSLIFSKRDKDAFQIADNERRSLALKYTTARLL